MSRAAREARPVRWFWGRLGRWGEGTRVRSSEGRRRRPWAEALEGRHLLTGIGGLVSAREAGGVSIVDVHRLGVRRQPTRIVLSFDGPLEPGHAQIAANYRLVAPGRNGRFDTGFDIIAGRADDVPIRIPFAVYDPNAQTVTLASGRRLGRRQRYLLTVNATTPIGLTDTSGTLIDGNGDGQAGGNFAAILRGSRVVLTDP